MQELPPALRPGAEVRARGRSWSVQSVEPAETATAVDLVGLGPGSAGLRRTLLVPFDEVTLAPAARRPQLLREGTAWGALRALIGSAIPWPAPGAAVPAAIDLLPHQLSAAIALRTDLARRVLIADPVGSGKTIHAGLAVADLLDHRPGARVLVVVPAGLRQQWADELRARFALDPRQVDGATCMQGEWHASAENPWSRPGITLTSLDYVKRPEVLASLDTLRWDLLVVDEAHHASPGSERGSAIGAISSRSLAVLLLTATPHDGDEARFRGLCDLGRLHGSDALLILRRAPRLLARGAPRRTHVLGVAESDAELRVRHLLAGYGNAMRDAASRRSGALAEAGHLLASVFAKRAASSPAALERSASRRLAIMTGGEARDRSAQGLLPFDGEHALWEAESDDTDDGWLAIDGPMEWRKERAWLGALVEAARCARRACGKVAALRRMLRRLREPVIVFTEYRDTLAWLLAELRAQGPSALLHGLQPPSERQQQLDTFDRGDARWLLTTDVAAEGLNLHRRCRVVIEFDVPWTPRRSEQRIGRVDRIGQRRRVHAWSLVARDGLDARLEDAVQARRSRAETGLAGHPSTCDRVGAVEHGCVRALALARRLTGPAPGSREHGGRNAGAVLHGASPQLVRARARRLHRLGLPPGAALVVTEVLVTAAHRQRIESHVVPLAIEFAPHVARPFDALRADTLLLEAVVEQARLLAARHSTPRVEALTKQLESAFRLDAEREAHVGQALRHVVAAHFAQPDLFGIGPIRRPPVVEPDPRCLPPPAIAIEPHVALIVVPRDRRNGGLVR